MAGASAQATNYLKLINYESPNPWAQIPTNRHVGSLSANIQGVCC
jgi:hypothetical protein